MYKPEDVHDILSNWKTRSKEGKHVNYDPIVHTYICLFYCIFTDWLIDWLVFAFVVIFDNRVPGTWPQTGLNLTKWRRLVWALEPWVFTCPVLGLWVGMNMPGSDTNAQSPDTLGSLVCPVRLLVSGFLCSPFMIKHFSLVSPFWWLPGPRRWSLLLPCLSEWWCASLTLPLTCYLFVFWLFFFLFRGEEQKIRVQELILTSCCGPRAQDRCHHRLDKGMDCSKWKALELGRPGTNQSHQTAVGAACSSCCENLPRSLH